jgi:hypothetical protein
MQHVPTNFFCLRVSTKLHGVISQETSTVLFYCFLRVFRRTLKLDTKRSSHGVLSLTFIIIIIIIRRLTSSVCKPSFKQRNFASFQKSLCILSVGTSVWTFVSAIGGTCSGGYQLISSSRVNTCGPQLCTVAGQLQNVNPAADYICTCGERLQNRRRHALKCVPVWESPNSHCFARR